MKAATRTRRRQGFQLTRWRRRWRLQEEKTKAVTGGGDKDAKKAPELREVRRGSLTQIGICGLWRRKIFFRFNFML
ncbi:BnaAnng36030D [Brassica napus]|uniref:BnaAnng36030D protein n=1 Tax=Brassica napus TaxID=3708 RepID=A0A078JZH9_BRANA|nr:BnaAnng36030D [Brassica napus]